jgi:hypothetical protein
MDPILLNLAKKAIEEHPHEWENHRKGKANVTYLAGWVLAALRARNPDTQVTLANARKAVVEALSESHRG